ncbi:HpcH/HpaI aldolase/citrate lyase family protein [Neomicrococcus aestuarii]|uniref:HpcH/HpaI aldolase/citrate lyase family protein n=1 Tax=Neomicrococcus aestuarii TaxID=556325 RepID=UPI000A029029|nr:CoA ester lyase [Neomicrococcus aestuarii]
MSIDSLTLETLSSNSLTASQQATARRAQDLAPEVGPELARTWLLVNGTHADRFDHADASGADVVVLDIEDAVAPKDKERARRNVTAWLDSTDEHGRQRHAWVRINGFGTQWWEEDLRELSGVAGLDGVMLAMVESPEHVTKTAEALKNTKIVALVETARGVQNLQDIATARSTYRLGFGLGDFRRDTGFGENPMTLAYTRSQFTIASRAANLPGPIDGPAVGALGSKLAESTAVSLEFGMTGKLCLMPEQVATVNEGLSPSLAELSWATEFLKEFDSDGGEIRNGSDLPRLARAKKVLGLAHAFNLHVPEGFDVHFEAPTDTYHC